MSKVYHRSDRDDWETPPDLFALLDAEFKFTLDVCATSVNAKCPRYFAPPDIIDPGCVAYGGLGQSWAGETCWMNPPYSEAAMWLHKARAEGRRGTLAVCLVAARTDTRAWFEDIWAHAAEVRFLKGRVRFVGGEASAPFPSAIVIYRSSVARPRAWGWDWRAAAKERADG